jgi:hypothetical protein
LNKAIFSLKGLGVMFIVGCLIPVSQGIAQTKSNLDIIRLYLVDYLSAVIDSSLEESGNIQMQLEQNDETGLWWKETLREFLLEKKITINSNFDQNFSDSYKLVLERTRIKIDYYPKKRKYFFKTSSYQRQISGLCSFILINKQGNLSLSRLKEFNYEDEISASDLRRVENEHFLFTNGTKMESKFIKRLVEPMIITATTAGVVYLFYSLRSGS